VSRRSSVAPAAARPDRRAPALHWLTQNAGLVLAIAMLTAAVIAYCAVYYATQQRFPGGFELTSTVNSTLPLVMAGVGQTIVILTRGLDLSVGGVVDLTNAIGAVTLSHGGVGGMVLWTIVILAVGALCGLLNGLLVAIGRLQPILVTLATLSIYQGLAIRVLPQPGGEVPETYTAALTNPASPTSLVYVVAVMLLWAAFRRSGLGVSVFAIGNDEQAARAHGIRVERTKVLAYVLSGVLAAAAGLFQVASSTAGDATTGNSYTLTSIVAVVLGGVSLFGGRGSAVGTVMGAFVTTMIVNILFFAHIDPLYQAFYEGVFLIAAVLLAGGIGRLVRGRS
jgi:ribose transport system permease protein